MTSFCVRFVPMESDLLSTTDPDTGVIYVRDDATPAEVGHAIVTELATLGIPFQARRTSE